MFESFYVRHVRLSMNWHSTLHSVIRMNFIVAFIRNPSSWHYCYENFFSSNFSEEFRIIAKFFPFYLFILSNTFSKSTLTLLLTLLMRNDSVIIQQHFFCNIILHNIWRNCFFFRLMFELILIIELRFNNIQVRFVNTWLIVIEFNVKRECKIWDKLSDRVCNKKIATMLLRQSCLSVIERNQIALRRLASI